MKNEKLTVCFNPWMIFSANDDYENIVSEIAERGYNCIRFDDGAGMYRDKDGNIRKNILISAPFGKYTAETTYGVVVGKEYLNLADRVLRICAAAKKTRDTGYIVKLVFPAFKLVLF